MDENFGVPVTPLQSCAEVCDSEGIGFLIRHGADVGLTSPSSTELVGPPYAGDRPLELSLAAYIRFGLYNEGEFPIEDWWESVVDLYIVGGRTLAMDVIRRLRKEEGDKYWEADVCRKMGDMVRLRRLRSTGVIRAIAVWLLPAHKRAVERLFHPKRLKTLGHFEVE
jgi:hypothetical protein